MKFLGKVGNRLMNKRLNFGGDPDPGKACLGGGMHCPGASSYIIISLNGVVCLKVGLIVSTV